MHGCARDLHSSVVVDTAFYKRSPVLLAARQKHHVGRSPSPRLIRRLSPSPGRGRNVSAAQPGRHYNLHKVDGELTLRQRLLSGFVRPSCLLSPLLVFAALGTVYSYTPPPSPRISSHLQGRAFSHQRRRSLSTSFMAVDQTEVSVVEEGGVRGASRGGNDQDVTAKPATTGTLFGIGLHDSLKYVSLVLLTLQNAILILVMRYVRTREGDMFMATSAVISAEALKFSACIVIIFLQEGCSIRKFCGHMNENIFQQPIDCLKISVPSIVYTLQNNLLYVALTNLEAATFQVTYQLKILTTAIFSVFMLRKHLTKLQWLSLFFLFCGVAIVQLQSSGKSTSHAAAGQNPVIGLVAVIVSCLMSGFAGVYFEKILKGTKQTLWLRNVQLGFLGMVFGYITMEMNDGAKFHEKGFLFGYDIWVWVVICLQSFGGLMVAVVVKYADNILKGFATSAAIILSCVVSIYLFDFQLTLQFTFGASLVILSVYMYSRFVPKATEGNQVAPKSVSKV